MFVGKCYILNLISPDNNAEKLFTSIEWLLNISDLALCITLGYLRLEAVLIIRIVRVIPGVHTPIIAHILRLVPPVLTQSVGVIQLTQVRHHQQGATHRLSCKQIRLSEWEQAVESYQSYQSYRSYRSNQSYQRYQIYQSYQLSDLSELSAIRAFRDMRFIKAIRAIRAW